MTQAKFDLVSIRVRPLQPWERYRETWDDILSDIESNGGLEEALRRIDKHEREIAQIRMLQRSSAQVALENQRLLKEVYERFNQLLAKLLGEGGP